MNNGQALPTSLTSQPRLLLRTDAGPHRGYGHVMRCLTLGAELRRRGWAVTLLAQDLSPFLHDRATSEGIQVRPMIHQVGSLDDAAEVLFNRADLVVVDGYDFPSTYFEFLDEKFVAYVVIDDNGETRTHGALLIINQNPHASESMYPGFEPARLLLGAEFAMVRSEVTRLAREYPATVPASRPTVLVSIGGTDIGGLTRGVTEALLQNGNWNVIASLAKPPAGAASAPADIATALASATVAVIGAGSTLWEACFLGVPTVALIVADNQVPGSGAAAQMGACELLDLRGRVAFHEIRRRVERLVTSPSSRGAIRAAGERLIDGHGASRVANSLERALVIC